MEFLEGLIREENQDLSSDFLKRFRVSSKEDFLAVGYILGSFPTRKNYLEFFKAEIRISESPLINIQLRAKSIEKFYKELWEISAFDTEEWEKKKIFKLYRKSTKVINEIKEDIKINLEINLASSLGKLINSLMRNWRFDLIVLLFIADAPVTLKGMDKPASYFKILNEEEKLVLKKYEKITSFDEISSILLKIIIEITNSREENNKEIVDIWSKLLCFGLKQSQTVATRLNPVLVQGNSLINKLQKSKILEAYEIYCFNLKIEQRVETVQLLCSTELNIQEDILKKLEFFTQKQKEEIRNLFIEIESSENERLLAFIINHCLEINKPEEFRAWNFILKCLLEIKASSNLIYHVKKHLKKIEKETSVSFNFNKKELTISDSFEERLPKSNVERRKNINFFKQTNTTHLNSYFYRVLTNSVYEIIELYILTENMQPSLRMSFQSLEKIVKLKVPNCYIFTIGAIKNGTWTTFSCIDVQINEKKLSYTKLLELHPIFHENNWEIKLENKFHEKKLKLKDNTNNFSYNLYLNKSLSLETTSLIQAYLKLSKTASEMIIYLKLWSKTLEVNKTELGYPSGFVLSLLVIYFLQIQNPPILPNLQSMFHTPKYIESVDTSFASLKEYQTENRTSLAELIIEFFRFYSTDFIESQDEIVDIHLEEKKQRKDCIFPVLHPFTRKILTPKMTFSSIHTENFLNALHSTYYTLSECKIPLKNNLN